MNNRKIIFHFQICNFLKIFGRRNRKAEIVWKMNACGAKHFVGDDESEFGYFEVLVVVLVVLCRIKNRWNPNYDEFIV